MRKLNKGQVKGVGFRMDSALINPKPLGAPACCNTNVFHKEIYLTTSQKLNCNNSI